MNKSGSEDDPRFKIISNAIDELSKGAWEPIKGNFELRATKTTQEERDCLRCLFLSDPADDRQRLIDNKDEVIDEVCEWILSDRNYNSWFRNPSSQLLWLSGGPGKGKTFISIFLTGKLAEIVKQSQHQTLIYFFCDSKDEKTNTAVAILRGLIFQLLSGWPDLFQYILPNFQTQGDRLFSSGSAFQGLWRIFENMIRSLKYGVTLYCIIDGLDECEPKSLHTLSRNLGRLFSATTTDQSHGIFKLLVVSRDSPDCIRKQLTPFGQRVDLDSPALEEGVISNAELFISHKSRMLFEERDYPMMLQKYIVEELMKNAKVGLLWVALVCSDLEQKEIIEVRNTLGSNLPTELDGIYRRILLQINETRREIATTIFRWVTAAVRPLTLSELAAATKTGPIESLSAERVMRDKVGFCGSFLKIDKQDNVTFIHQSAKEYLLQKQLELIPDNWFRVDLAAANLELARACLEYVQGRAFVNGAVNINRHSDGRWYGETESDIAHLRIFPLLQYATLCWPEHARALGPAEDVFDLSTPFFKQASPIRTAWLWTYWKIDHQHSIPHGILPCPATLHIASSLGLTPLVEKIMVHESIEIDSEANNDSGLGALHCAVRGKHIDTVELLLQEGARINKKNKLGETVLHIAAEGGSGDIVKILLEGGIAIDEKNERGETALHLAVEWGNEDIVKLLLEEGAAVNGRSKWGGGTALHLAARGGNESIVKALLKSGAAVNRKNEWGRGVALHFAVEGGNENVVRALLENNAAANEKNEFGDTPLHFSVQKGNAEIVRLLLGKGTAVNEENKFGETALHLAVERGSIDIVKVLLEYGAVVKKNDAGETVLHLATQMGNEDIVKMLLEEGMTDEKNNRGETSLHFAVQKGNEGIAKMLLDRGAINERNEQGETALHIAVQKGNEEIIRVLLERGAAVDEENCQGKTALHLAQETGNRSIIKVLLGKNVATNEQKRKTALPHPTTEASNEGTVSALPGTFAAAIKLEMNIAFRHAIKAGDKGIVKILLEKGAEVNGKYPYPGEPALHLAVRVGEEGVVKMLLDKGAEVNGKYPYPGEPALHLAVRVGEEGVVKMLLDKGAEVNKLSLSGETALHVAVSAGKEDIVKMLLERGAKVNGKYPYPREPALHLAVRVGKKGIVKMLLDRYAEVNKLSFSSETALHVAVSAGKEDIVKMLLGRGAEVNEGSLYRGVGKVRVYIRQTALHLAARAGEESIARLLLGRGAKVDKKNFDGETALHLAVGAGKEGIVKVLLEGGAEVNQKDADEETALHLAARAGNEDVVRELLKWDAKVNEENRQGNSTLYLATRQGNKNIIEMLIQQGAVDKRANFGK